MKANEDRWVVGLDVSVSACGVAVGIMRTPSLHERSFEFRASTVFKSAPSENVSHRFYTMAESVLVWLCDNVPHGERVRSLVGIENFAFGAKFNREIMGMATGSVRCLIYHGFAPTEPVLVTPRAVKVAACPDHHGLNKENWTASGKTTKFKSSMPEKQDVIAGLFKRYGVNVWNDAEADAVCVALATIAKVAGVVPVRYGDQTPEVRPRPEVTRKETREVVQVGRHAETPARLF